MAESLPFGVDAIPGLRELYEEHASAVAARDGSPESKARLRTASAALSAARSEWRQIRVWVEAVWVAEHQATQEAQS